MTGIKPSYGRVSRYGLIAYASSFDSIGPIGHSVADTALVLSVIAGRDEKDGTTSHAPLDPYLDTISQPRKGLRVGVPAEYFGEGLDPEIRARIEDVIQALKKDGATIVPIQLPLW